MLPTALTALLVPLLSLFPHGKHRQPNSSSRNAMQFELRHQHAVSSAAHVIFTDITSSHSASREDPQTSFSIQTRKITSHRPPSFAVYSKARSRSLEHSETERIPWEEEEILAPDVESRETLLELAKMTNNAYLEVDDPAWYDLGSNWTAVSLQVR